MSTPRYEFVDGYPTEETVQRAYDDADYIRALTAYKFFYPTVSFSVGFANLVALGFEPSAQPR